MLEEEKGLGQNAIPDPEGRPPSWGGRVAARELCDSGSGMLMLSDSMHLFQWLRCCGETLLG